METFFAKFQQNHISEDFLEIGSSTLENFTFFETQEEKNVCYLIKNFPFAMCFRSSSFFTNVWKLLFSNLLSSLWCVAKIVFFCERNTCFLMSHGMSSKTFCISLEKLGITARTAIHFYMAEPWIVILELSTQVNFVPSTQLSFKIAEHCEASVLRRRNGVDFFLVF